MSDTTTTVVDSTPGADSAPPEAKKPRKSGGLSTMLLPELQSMASGLGISGTARMRKGELVDAIKSAQGGARSAPRAERPSEAPAPEPAAPASTETAEPRAAQGDRQQGDRHQGQRR